MKPRQSLSVLLAHIAVLATLSFAASPSGATEGVAASAAAESPCPGGAAEDPVRLLEEDALEAENKAEAKRVGFNAWGGKRVGFNAWGGKRAGGEAVRPAGWAAGVRDGVRDGMSRIGASPEEEAIKRVGFNAWGGKRSRFSAWGGKRGPEVKAPRAFFPWGGKRDGGAEAEEDEDVIRGSADWIYSGQPEEYVGNREGNEGEAAWGRTFGRGRRSPASTRNRLIATVEDPTISDGIPWERKRLAALWRAANLQPPRQNRRATGADFFPWGGKRSTF